MDLGRFSLAFDRLLEAGLLHFYLYIYIYPASHYGWLGFRPPTSLPPLTTIIDHQLYINDPNDSHDHSRSGPPLRRIRIDCDLFLDRFIYMILGIRINGAQERAAS